jgi:alcohol dehydrogenase, propanol-preferring
MQAWRLARFGAPAQLMEVDVPVPGPGQVRVRVAGNGLCHSDVGLMDPRFGAPPLPGWQLPFTLGHEIGGWVDATGAGVSGFSRGQPVVLVATQSDGTCAYCRRGEDNNCEVSSAGRGYGRDGGLAPYVLVDSTRPLIALKTLDPVTAGPLADAGATAFHAVRRVLPRLEAGSTAVVLGVGGLGSFAVQLLRTLSAARVVGVDLNPARLLYARELGAHECVPGANADTAADLRRLTQGQGADVVLDFVGVDATIEAGLASVRRTGSFGLIGAGMGRLHQPWFHALPRDGEVFTFTGSTIADLTAVIALAEQKRLRNDTERFRFDQVPEAYERLERGDLRGRAVVLPEH